MEPAKIQPLPPVQIEADPPEMRLRPNPLSPIVMLKKLLLKLKESTTWVGLAVIAQFLPIGVEELQVVWTAITAVAGAVLLFLDEDKTKKAKQDDQAG